MLKEYINTEFADVYNLIDIKSIAIYTKVFGGNIIADIIQIEWVGWWSNYNGTWIYSDNRTNQFNLDLYKEWLVDIRDKKLEELLDYTLD